MQHSTLKMLHLVFERALDNRGDRQGFPFEVIEELMFLQEIHDYRLGKRTTVPKEGYRIG